jgi:GNAT superfamily N-acetyltransferase
MSEYDFTQVSTPNNRLILDLLRKSLDDLTEAEVEWAMSHHYQLFTLRRGSQLLGVAGVHAYPHLTDTKRAWIHDLITVKDQGVFEYKSVFIASLRNQYLSPGCPEIAIHVPVDDESENQFFLQEAGQPFAFVYEWMSSSWLSVSEQAAPIDDFQCRELKTPEDMASGLVLLRHFHPDIAQSSLTDAVKEGYRIFGLWIGDQLCSTATLIYYPHLKNGICVWLQDGMTLPTRRYKEVASSLFRYILDSCFSAGSLTVTAHARTSNKRIHRFYEETGGQHIANAYKWKTSFTT